MDYRKQKTIVSVHSPIIQFLSIGSCYTSYAISLKTQDPSFTHSSSQVRRRYSEFLQLRNLLESHYPTLTAPSLPPKRYFRKFSDEFIEERKNGLQGFLQKVLETTVYLSDKSLHLFLQSSCNMTQISKECLGDIPVPQLIDENSLPIVSFSDTSSCQSSEKSMDSMPIKTTRSHKMKYEDMDSDESGYASPPHTVSSNPDIRNKSAPYKIPECQTSTLSSSPCSSLSSLDNSYSSSLENQNTKTSPSHRVSFNEHVTVAFVYNQIWNVCTEPIRTD